MAFPSSPLDGQIYKNYKYDSTKGAWIYSPYISYDASGNVIITPESGERIELNNGETWHEVGASGEPAFENGWVTYNPSYNTAAFYKDVEGFVHLKGMVGSGTANTTIFTLPTGYRPDKLCLLIAWSNGASCRIDIKADGTIATQGGSNNYVSLDGITFYAGY